MALDDSLRDLIKQGQQIDEITEPEQYEIWKRTCKRLLNGNFPRTIGINSKEGYAFSHIDNIQDGVLLLQSFMGRESSPGRAGTTINVNQSQTANIHNSISLQVLLNIDNSKELSQRQKEDAKELYKQVETEVQKENTDWGKVTGWLKNSLDYGLKIAPDIIKLAEMYYRAKT